MSESQPLPIDAGQSVAQFSGFGGTTEVQAEACDLQWLREFFHPSLESGGGMPVTETVRTLRNSRLYAELRIQWENLRPRDFECFTLDGRFEKFPGCRTAAGELLINLERFRLMLRVCHRRSTVELVAAHPSARFRLGLMRVIRELATVRALKSGGVPFHGAACADERGATGFLGQKTAGKSTALVHALLSEGRHFVANDRFFITWSSAGLLATGMPTIVRIRTGTFDLFPELASRAQELPFHRERTLEELRTQPGEPSRDEAACSFSQAQFLQIIRRTALSSTKIWSILFPERDDTLDTPQLVPLTVDEVTPLLMANLLSPGARLQTSEVFDSSSQREIPRHLLQQKCRQIGSLVCCQRYRQGIRTINLPARLATLSPCA